MNNPLTLKEIQFESLRIMKIVHKFCVENNIRYSFEGGSLIGAVRHHGFIPWDDDLDILMPRPDYDRFCEIFSADNLVIKKPGELGYYLQFARVFDTERTIVKNHKTPFTDVMTGMWIDIFPIDGIPNDKDTFVRLANRCQRQKMYSWDIRRWNAQLYNIKSINNFMRRQFELFMLYIKKYKIQIKYREINNIPRMFAKQANNLRKNNFETSKWSGGLCYANTSILLRYPKEWFEEYIIVPFEDDELFIIKHYHELLSRQFGKYMELPPEEKRLSHNYFQICWK